jgi:hypothetical protein
MSNENDPILQFFISSHLPPDLQPISYHFDTLAEWIVKVAPRNPERTIALRNLLLAKDSIIRSKIYIEPDFKPTSREIK